MTENTESTPIEENQDTLQTENIVEETIDYNELSLEELIEKVNQFNNFEKIYLIAKEVETIKSIFYKKLSEEKTASKNSYVEAGGEEEAFIFDPKSENDFKLVYKQFKRKKAESQ